MKTGIEASLKNIDVKTALDYQKLFSSEWPMLKIAFHGTATVDLNGAADVTLFTHGLGYVPVFLIWVQSNDGTEVTMNSINQFKIDNDKLICHQEDWGGAFEVTIFYYIFRHELLTNFQAPFVEQNVKPATSSMVSDVGIKIALKGKSVKSTDPRDFVVHSSYKNLPIHQQGYGSQTIPAPPPFVAVDVTIYHNLGYAPLTFFYLKRAGQNYWEQIHSSQETAVDLDSLKAHFVALTVAGVQEYAYIIFKDPLTLGG